MTAYRQLASWRGDGPFGAWLDAHRRPHRAAPGREAAGRSRGATRWHPGRVAGRRIDPITQAMDQAALDSAPLTDPAVLSMRAERATELRAAVIALPEPYREVVALRFFAEATLDEIARQTGRPLGTVKTHLHRGLARLPDRDRARRPMSEFGHRFDPSELAERGARPATARPPRPSCWPSLATSRRSRRSESVTPSVDFEDRVMAALANEPPPRAVSAGGVAGLVDPRARRVAVDLERRPAAGRAGAGPRVRAAGRGGARVVGDAGGGRCREVAVAAAPPPSAPPAPSPTPSPRWCRAEPSPSPTPVPRSARRRARRRRHRRRRQPSPPRRLNRPRRVTTRQARAPGETRQDPDRAQVQGATRPGQAPAIATAPRATRRDRRRRSAR